MVCGKTKYAMLRRDALGRGVPRMRVREIMQIVCRCVSNDSPRPVSPQEILSRRRSVAIAEARQLVYYLARCVERTFPEIAHSVNRQNPKLIYNGVLRVAQRLEAGDQKLQERVIWCMREMRNRRETEPPQMNLEQRVA